MPDYSLTFAKSARKELEKLPSQTADRVLGKIELPAAAPRLSGCQKPKGQNDLWRVRIGDYRVLYEINDVKRNVDIVAIGNRKDVYRS